MKIVILYGSPRKGISYTLTQTAKKVIAEKYDAQFTEFFLPQDAPAFCKGCYNCIYRDEAKCPDAQYIVPIVQAMREADGWIVVTSIYSLQLTAALKAFLDHTSYNYVTHRPQFYGKKALLIAVSAGAGIKKTLAYLKENFSYWLLNRIYTVGIASMASKMEEIGDERRIKMEEKIAAEAERFGVDVAAGVLHEPSLLQTIYFRAISLMLKGFDKENIDRRYWESKGWMEKGVSYIPDVKRPNLFKRAVQGFAGTMMKLLIK